MSKSNSLVNKAARRNARALKRKNQGLGVNFLGVLPDRGLKNKYGVRAEFTPATTDGGFGSCKVVN